MKGLSNADFIILLIYLSSMVAVGLWIGRKNRTSDKFMAAGRSIPGWAVGLSIFGTYVSSISFLALPGKAYGSNWNAFVFSLSIPVTTWLAVRYFVPFYRRSGEVSAYTHLENRFGPWARTYAVICYLLTQLARMGTIMYLLALALAPITGWNVVSLILITGIIVIAYTLVGGMEAVIWTDVVQSFILIGGAFACVVILFLGMPQGYGQRYATARTDKEAAKSVWLGGLLYLPISAVFFFIGTQLFAYYNAQPQLLPAKTKPDQVFPHFIATGLPIGVGGLVIAAVFAAAQSTLSSSINCSATLILCDLYKRYIRPGATEKESMFILRISTLLVGIAGTLTALAMIHVKSALDVWWELASIFSGGMLGLFLLGIISRHTKNPSAVTGVIIGVLLIFWISLSPTWTGNLARFSSPFHKFMIIVVGTLTILLIGLLISRLTPDTTGKM